MATTATETKLKTSPAYQQLDRMIVDREANLVVQGASTKVVMSPVGMADGEAIRVEQLKSFSNGFNGIRHGGVPYGGEPEPARRQSLKNTPLVVRTKHDFSRARDEIRTTDRRSNSMTT